MISKTRFSVLSDYLGGVGTAVHGEKNRSSMAEFAKRQRRATAAALRTRLFWGGSAWPCRVRNADTVDAQRKTVVRRKRRAKETPHQ